MKDDFYTNRFFWRLRDESIYRDKENRTGGYYNKNDDISDLSDVDLRYFLHTVIENRDKNNKSLET
tara:strand:- start:336 stop:533 length:198 start_codon:yes stop_codon:yes gene_type:complete